jgi:hypothetical protein
MVPILILSLNFSQVSVLIWDACLAIAQASRAILDVFAL